MLALPPTSIEDWPRLSESGFIMNFKPAQISWFASAEVAKRQAFMSKGPVGVLEVDVDGRVAYAPALRGVKTGTDHFASFEQAFCGAFRVFDEFSTLELPVLDEVTLGIDDAEPIVQEGPVSEHLLMGTQVLWIKQESLTYPVVSDALAAFAMECLDEHLVHHLGRWIPGLHAMNSVRENKDAPSAFAQILRNNGVEGVLICCKTPAVIPHLQSNGEPVEERTGAYTWASALDEWFFGDTLEVAVARALDWSRLVRREEVLEGRQEMGLPA